MTFEPYVFGFICVVFLIALVSVSLSPSKLLSITGDGIRLRGRLGERYLKWDEIKTIAKGSEISRGTFIAIKPRKFLSLPATFVVRFSDQEGADRFVSAVRAHMPVDEARDPRSFFSRRP